MTNSTNRPKENPAQKTTEVLPEVKTTRHYIDGLGKIGTEFSNSQKRQESTKGAKELALKQLKELSTTFTKYTSTEYGKKTADRDMADLACNINSNILWWWRLEEAISHAEILLTGTDEQIVQAINWHFNRSSWTFDSLMLPFVPEKYLKNGQINADVIKKMDDSRIHQDLKKYIDGENRIMPAFDNTTYIKDPKLVEQALSRSGSILRIYESLNNDKTDSNIELLKNPDFVHMLDVILAKEYPDFFGKAHETDWYRKKKTDFNKIRTLLDIIKYRPDERKKSFLDIMNGPKEWKMDESFELFEKYFLGTDIGYEIDSYFKDSDFVIARSKKIKQIVTSYENNQKNEKWGVYDIIKKSEYGKDLIADGFDSIPERDLNTFLSELPTIERLGWEQKEKELKNYIDALDIDISYKQRFFSTLWNLSATWWKESEHYYKTYSNLSTEYYKEMNVKDVRDKIRGDVRTGNCDIRSKEEKKEEQLHIISKENFPHASEELLNEKNQRLKRLLNDTIDDNGKYKISSKALKEELLAIFEWSPIKDKLQRATEGKQALEILASVAEQEKRSTNKEMKAIENTFDSKKIEELQKNDPEGYSALKKLLESNQSIDVKIDALEKYGIISGNTIKPEDKERFITLAKNSFENHMKSQVLRSTLDDKVKLQAFESYWRGDIKSPADLNAKIAERDKEIKQAEAAKQGKENQVNPLKSYDNLQSFGTDFSKIPDGRIITYKDGENDIYIKKDSKNEISIFASGVPIRGIKITNETDPKADIAKAMDSVGFIKDCGLDIFGTSLPKMIDIINSKQKGKWERKIDLADGLDAGGAEERILLQYIAKMVDIDAALPIENLRREFSEIRNEHGLLPRLQKKPGYVTANSLNMTTILGDLEKTRI